MKNTKNKSERTTKWIRWIARIWSSPIIVYFLIMLTGYAWNWATIGKVDPHSVEGYPIVEALPPIFMFLSVFGLIRHSMAMGEIGGSDNTRFSICCADFTSNSKTYHSRFLLGNDPLHYVVSDFNSWSNVLCCW